MKKSVLVSGLTMIVASGSLASEPVQAEGPVSVSANVALSTDYVFRYVSQTMEEPAISGGVDLACADTGFYLGTWASNVDFGDDATIEVDFYGGWTAEFANGLGPNVGLIDYEYFGWSIGVSTELVGLGLDLTYYDTDSDGEDLFGENLADGRVVFTASKEI